MKKTARIFGFLAIVTLLGVQSLLSVTANCSKNGIAAMTDHRCCAQKKSLSSPAESLKVCLHCTGRNSTPAELPKNTLAPTVSLPLIEIPSAQYRQADYHPVFLAAFSPPNRPLAIILHRILL